MKIDILTLFPSMFSPLSESILGKAQEKGLLDITVTNIRDFTLDKHNKTDEYPFGGGVGMVMTCDPIFRTLEHIGTDNRKLIYMSPRGNVLDQEKILELKDTDPVILCGHYEGVDQRILEYYDMEKISIGDYILTGGELAAMVLVDSVARMVPGVLKSETATMEESVYSGLLESPQYTKPRVYKEMEVPEVLLSGHHKNIHLWNLEQSLLLTAKRRPDLLKAFAEKKDLLTKEEIKLLEKALKCCKIRFGDE